MQKQSPQWNGRVVRWTRQRLPARGRHGYSDDFDRADVAWVAGGEFSPRERSPTQGTHVIAYRAMLDLWSGYSAHVSGEREKLRRRLEQLPDEEVSAVLEEGRRRLVAVGERSRPGVTMSRRGRRRSWVNASAARCDHW